MVPIPNLFIKNVVNHVCNAIQMFSLIYGDILINSSPSQQKAANHLREKIAQYKAEWWSPESFLLLNP